MDFVVLNPQKGSVTTSIIPNNLSRGVPEGRVYSRRLVFVPVCKNNKKTSSSSLSLLELEGMHLGLLPRIYPPTQSSNKQHYRDKENKANPASTSYISAKVAQEFETGWGLGVVCCIAADPVDELLKKTKISECSAAGAARGLPRDSAGI
jgi:hypothetical protein